MIRDVSCYQSSTTMFRSRARHQAPVETGGERRIRLAAETLCTAVERRMDELIRLVEEETQIVREGKMFALRELEPKKKQAAREFITGLEAVKKIRPALEQHAPDAILRLRRRHSEFRSMLQLNLAALATAREVSDGMLRAITDGRSFGYQSA